MDIGKITDLSHTILPGKEEYRLDIDTRQVDEWEQFKKYPRKKNAWYIISEITFNTHVGTHIELPYHHTKDGYDAATFPLEGLVGEAIVLDISRWKNNDEIKLSDMETIGAGNIAPGDIVYFYTGMDRYYRTEKQHSRPWFNTEVIEWLVHEAKIKVMGIDASGIEVRSVDSSPFPGQPNHEVLFKAGVPLIEFLTNLKRLINTRFLTFILPVKITGAEAFPVRIIGIE